MYFLLLKNCDIPASYVSLPDGISHGKSLILIHMDVSKNRGVSPQIIPFVHRVFHYFHHPFWDTPIFGNTIYIYCPKISSTYSP